MQRDKELIDEIRNNYTNDRGNLLEEYKFGCIVYSNQSGPQGNKGIIRKRAVDSCKKNFQGGSTVIADERSS